MVGCLGLSEPHHLRVPYDLMVEANARLDVWMLLRRGSLVEGTVTYVKMSDGSGVRLTREGGFLQRNPFLPGRGSVTGRHRASIVTSQHSFSMITLQCAAPCG